MSQWVVHASLTLGWFLEDERDRAYGLSVLERFDENNGERLQELPITVERPQPDDVMQLPNLALKHNLTAYGAAYLELAIRLGLPIATRDNGMKRAMSESGVSLVVP